MWLILLLRAIGDMLTGRWASGKVVFTEYAIGSGGYIYVEDDGRARELTRDEAEYLDTPFHPNDGARPWIKSNYDDKDGHGRMSGFLKRAGLPRGTTVRSSGEAAAP